MQGVRKGPTCKPHLKSSRPLTQEGKSTTQPEKGVLQRIIESAEPPKGPNHNDAFENCCGDLLSVTSLKFLFEELFRIVK